MLLNHGENSGGATPVLIPNTRVKSTSAYDTRISWESGSLPEYAVAK